MTEELTNGLEILKNNTIGYKRANDILTDYEGLHGQLYDLLDVLELAQAEEGCPRGTALLNTAVLSLKTLRAEHQENIDIYQKGCEQ